MGLSFFKEMLYGEHWPFFFKINVRSHTGRGFSLLGISQLTEILCTNKQNYTRHKLVWFSIEYYTPHLRVTITLAGNLSELIVYISQLSSSQLG